MFKVCNYLISNVLIIPKKCNGTTLGILRLINYKLYYIPVVLITEKRFSDISQLILSSIYIIIPYKQIYIPRLNIITVSLIQDNSI